jgi:hypothetical protein
MHESREPKQSYSKFFFSSNFSLQQKKYKKEFLINLFETNSPKIVLQSKNEFLGTKIIFSI